ncbi:ABC transporter substrate-binding protein [Leisingera sp. ANG-DT]|uniref:ABC transporter substrate-binding protein n=1 Tax=Leisingera sp. ANG-DT TaxID=1577897 RepID=UPI00057CFCB9|nr:ABC transporter substrate-binding protein [Leisingera sp. ANG-DT]KIC15697.1 ABC transporter substrate-binding protein [Leisingera sp. ANG-DT]
MLKTLTKSAAAVALASTASVTFADGIPVTDDVADSGKLTIASGLSYAPFNMVDENGNPAGLDIETAQAAADILGVELDILVIPFSNQIPSLAADRIKVAWATFTVTEERLGQVDFVAFMQTGSVVVTTPDLAASFEGDMAYCGRNIGVQTGSAGDFQADQLSESCVEAGKEAIEKSIYPEQKDVIQALLSGRVEARLDDATSAGYYQKTSGGKQVVVGAPMLPAPLGVAIRKGDTATADMLLATFNEMMANGSYQSVLEGYSMTAASLDKPILYTDASQLAN